MQANFTGKREIYLEVAEKYESYIKLGILAAGEKLPSVRAAAQDMGINPNTMALAYSYLEERGLIYTLPKKGVYVTYEGNEPKPKQPDPDFVQAMTEWITDGGRTTMEGYRALDEDGREGVLDYLMDMPLYEEIRVGGKDYLLLHCGIYDFCENLDLDELEPQDFFSEAIDATAHYFDDKTIIAGHTVTTEDNGGDGRIFYGNGSIFIDCGLGRGGRLGCLRLEDGAEFYV